MSQINGARAGCRDVFHAFLVEKAEYDGFLEIPRLDFSDEKPKKLISFTKALKSTDFDCWVHFYQDDASFERIWNQPRTYLPILKKFAGVISPDFSLYRDMPLVMQYWNIFRNRAIGRWLQDNGVKVIPNVRWGDRRSHVPCCYGVSHGGTVAVGSHGCVKILEDRAFFQEGLEYVVSTLRPKTIVVYGSAPDYIFEKYRNQGIAILQFDSEYAVSRREEDA
uniref:DUF4417 domain-containing protein n=1 Tax=Eubacterium cellulosolvens (strain ATCC 43171 / JCM 9499 / 6) TaxID=633697 RepID=I5AUD6_EUBC6